MGLLEKLFICLSFGFCRTCQLGPKKSVVLFWQVFPDSLFFEKLSTQLTMHCLKFLFHIDNHKDLFGIVTFLERIS